MQDNKKDTKDTVASGKPAFSSPNELIGKTIGDFKIIKEIGRGGMAIVYEAYQTSLDRNVALKLIPKALTEEKDYLERFKREASAAANLNHPNIVSIHGFGQLEDTYYYIMDLAHGKTLDAILEERKNELLRSARQFSHEDALKIIEQAANALSYAHKHGIIHRDIKPSNIVIEDETKRVLITDFGLAKSTRWEKITPRASLFGTPSYMSPEQASGKEIDHRTDIYSLGATLYEILTGKTPYEGDNALEVIDKIKQESITLPTKITPSIPKELEKIILKAISKDIRLRYRNMDEFINDIQKFLKTEKILKSAITASHIESARLFSRKIYLTLAYSFLTLILIFGVYIWQNSLKKKKQDQYLRSKIQLIENYMRLGMKEEAVKVYEEIIKKYPNTVYAKLAEEKISK